MIPYFLPKHQKLVNACYHESHCTDTNPDFPSAFILINNIDKNKVKLDKVLKYINSRTNSDIKNQKYSNVRVTLNLMFSLLRQEKSKLSIILLEYCDIIMNILQDHQFSKDRVILDVIEKIINYIAVNATTKIYLSTTNKGSLASLFASLLESYIYVTKNIIYDDELLLRGCIDLSISSNIPSDYQQTLLLKLSLTNVLILLNKNFPEFFELTKDESPVIVIENVNSDKVGGLSTNGEVDTACDKLLVYALVSLFNTDNIRKLHILLNQLFLTITDSDVAMLFLTIFKIIPSKFRFIVIKVILEELQTSKCFSEYDISTKLKYISIFFDSQLTIPEQFNLTITKLILNIQLNNYASNIVMERCANVIISLHNKLINSPNAVTILSYLFTEYTKIEKSNKIRNILSYNIITLMSSPQNSYIPIGMAIELIEYFPNCIDIILNSCRNVEALSYANFHLLYKLIRLTENIMNEDDQNRILTNSLKKYRNSMIVAGLQYIELSCVSPNNNQFYYIVHQNIAEFTESEEYIKLVKQKRKLKEFFTDIELLKFLKFDKSFPEQLNKDKLSNPSPYSEIESPIRFQNILNSIEIKELSNQYPTFIPLDEYLKGSGSSALTDNSKLSHECTTSPPRRRKIDMTIDDFQKISNIDIAQLITQSKKSTSTISKLSERNSPKEVPEESSPNDFDISNFLFHRNDEY